MLEPHTARSTPSKSLSSLCWGVLGLFTGGALAFRFLRFDDEDRPPIVVKGGSLYFISGDKKNGNPHFKYGKPWVHHQGAWKPKHDRGKKVTHFVVDLYPTNHTESSPKLPVTYKTEALTIKQGIAAIQVRIEAGPGNGRPAPALDGPLQAGASGANPEVVYHHDGSDTIDLVTFTTLEGAAISYEKPALVYIWQC